MSLALAIRASVHRYIPTNALSHGLWVLQSACHVFYVKYEKFCVFDLHIDFKREDWRMVAIKEVLSHLRELIYVRKKVPSGQLNTLK